jgi:hypothetical protein
LKLLLLIPIEIFSKTLLWLSRPFTAIVLQIIIREAIWATVNVYIGNLEKFTLEKLLRNCVNA